LPKEEKNTKKNRQQLTYPMQKKETQQPNEQSYHLQLKDLPCKLSVIQYHYHWHPTNQ
jgi:hypothetical protein